MLQSRVVLLTYASVCTTRPSLPTTYDGLSCRMRPHESAA